MSRNCIKANSAEKGFTLIELLVVIGILAILLAITLIAINPARQFAQGRDTQRRNTATQILNAIGGYFADHGGTLPTGLSGVQINTYFRLSNAGTPGLCGDIIPKYMPAIAMEPGMPGATDILPADCGSEDSGYYVMRDANNRVTVTSSSEVAAIDGAPADITVTR